MKMKSEGLNLYYTLEDNKRFKIGFRTLQSVAKIFFGYMSVMFNKNLLKKVN